MKVANKFLWSLCLAIIFTILPNCMKAQSPAKIVVDKPNFQIYVIQDTDTLFMAPVTTGENAGQKQRVGDHRTPEGTFTVQRIERTVDWPEYKTEEQAYNGGYGPYFIRLKTPKWRGIGIHGTNHPEKIGTHASEGCVRLKNEDLIQFKEFVFPGMVVEILPDPTEVPLPESSTDQPLP